MNVINAIHPYFHDGLWVFDDERVGLVQEPFVAGADLIIDLMVRGLPRARDGFTLIFSAGPFPGHQVVLERRREHMGGYWYYSPDLGFEGWLCPALFKYFDAAPERIYAQFKAKTIMSSTNPNESARDVPNLGLVRPPLVYLSAIIMGVILHLLAPISFFPSALALPVGIALVLIAIALLYSSIARFRAAGTPVPAYKPTTAIVRKGPYRFTRNPIYLSFSLLQLGIAIWVNSVWLVVTLVGAMVLMNYAVIQKEEQYLERRFGNEYLEYKGSVRRWL